MSSQTIPSDTWLPSDELVQSKRNTHKNNPLTRPPTQINTLAADATPASHARTDTSPPSSVTHASPTTPSTVHQFSGQLLDYCFVFGLTDNFMNTCRLADSTPKTSTEGVSNTTTRTDDGSTPSATAVHPLDARYEPRLLLRYPEKSLKIPIDDPFPPHLAFFCFPKDDGIRLRHVPPTKENAQRTLPCEFHAFVITDEYGMKHHAMCLTFWTELEACYHDQLTSQLDAWKSEHYLQSELEYIQHVQSKLDTELASLADPTSSGTLSEEEETERQERIAILRNIIRPYERVLMRPEDIVVPKVIGLIGHWPMYGLMHDWLLCFYNSCILSPTPIPPERWITHLISETPLPPPGKVAVQIPLPMAAVLGECTRPPLNCQPCIRTYPLRFLFACLSIDHVLRVFECLIAECKVVLVSDHLSALGIIGDALISLLFPMYWQHVYIPVLPLPLLSYLHAPVPFLVGVHRSLLSLEDEDLASDLVIVDLDQDVVVYTTRKKRMHVEAADTPTPEHRSYSPTSPMEENPMPSFQTSNAYMSYLHLDDSTGHLVPLLPSKDRRKLASRLKKHTRFQVLHDRRGVPTDLQAPDLHSLNQLFWCSRNVQRETRMQALNDEAQKDVKVMLDGWQDRFDKMVLKPGASSFDLGATVKGWWSSKSELGSSQRLEAVNRLQGEISRFAVVEGTDKPLPLIPLLESQRSSPDVIVQEVSAGKEEPVTEEAEEDKDVKESTDTDDHVRSATSSTRAIHEQTPSESVSNLTAGPEHKAEKNSSMFYYIMRRMSSVAETRMRTATDPAGMKSKRKGKHAPSSSSSSQRIMQQMSVILDNSKKRLLDSLTTEEMSKASSMSSLSTLNDDMEGSKTLNVPPEQDVTAKSATIVRHFVPFKPNKKDQQAAASHSLHNNVHLNWTEPESTYPYALQHDSNLIQQATIQRDRPLFVSGHELCHVYTVLTAPSPLPKDLAPPESMPLGVCAVCEQLVNTHLIADAQMTWLSTSVNQVSLVESKSAKANSPPFRQTSALQCRGCALTVHEACRPHLYQHCPCVMNERKVVEAFLRLWASVLKHYRPFLTVEQDPQDMQDRNGLQRRPSATKPSLPLFRKSTDKVFASNACPVFNKLDFLEQTTDREMKLFLARFCDTQAFVQFAYDRLEKVSNDYEILFFDEVIKAKLNRSKMKLAKESTPFLEDPAFGIASTYECIAPNTEELESWQPTTAPLSSWNADNELPPRKVEPLVTDKEAMKLKVYTSAIMRKARIEKHARKKTMTQWSWLAPKPKPSNINISVSFGSMRSMELEDLPDRDLEGSSDLDDASSSMTWSAGKFLRTASGADLFLTSRRGRPQEQATFEQRRAELNLKIDSIYRRLNTLLAETEVPVQTEGDSFGQLRGPGRFLEVKLRLDSLRNELLQCRAESRKLFLRDRSVIDQKQDGVSQTSEGSPTKSKTTTDALSPIMKVHPQTSEEDDILALEHQWYDLMDFCQQQLKQM